MRLGTTIAAVVLVGSLTSSTAEMSALSTRPGVARAGRARATAARRAGPGRRGAGRDEHRRPVGRRAAAAAAGHRTATARAVRGNGAAPSWSVNLSAGEGAGVAMVSGAVRLDPAGVFLAPLEDARGSGAAGTGSTGADAGPATAADRAPDGPAPRAPRTWPPPARRCPPACSRCRSSG